MRYRCNLAKRTRTVLALATCCLCVLATPRAHAALPLVGKSIGHPLVTAFWMTSDGTYEDPEIEGKIVEIFQDATWSISNAHGLQIEKGADLLVQIPVFIQIGQTYVFEGRGEDFKLFAMVDETGAAQGQGELHLNLLRSDGTEVAIYVRTALQFQ